ncbi:MAG TPA: tRNA uridine-5-carboxymethylaminomethyl(34) synthesis GTPase MnmE [Porticoccaceae bacterium]|nr:tRNA uridine-5-carboxymethylaminomethyl(34) synthesis GTPase MnmE [Porticoccaceae bacterium]
MYTNHTDTIVAIITPPGRGGVGIVRASGKDLKVFFDEILGLSPPPRQAVFCGFRDAGGADIDQGIALYFPGPGSYTGEDILELQAHGSPVVLDQLLQRCIHLGARLARPGEFSERAFLNNKLDLAQAEAVADLIDAGTAQAAKGALRALKGEFSKKVYALVDELTRLRVFIEAAIDFPEEEIDFLANSQIHEELAALINSFDELLAATHQGVLLKEGLNIVIAGEPNAGKSSLLNALAGVERAIVTDVPGTTRDIIKEDINVGGLPVQLVDTAGLRNSDDPVEKLGIERARQQIAEADKVFWVVDASTLGSRRSIASLIKSYPELQGRKELVVVVNKIDLVDWELEIEPDYPQCIPVSALSGQGLGVLRGCIESLGNNHGDGQGVYTARRRHVEALEKAHQSLFAARDQLALSNSGSELAAEDLRQAQQQLGAITGAVTSDDLLGEIFAGFCIGK